MPTVDHVGISKRIGSEKERKRLREAIDAFKPPRDGLTGGVIIRTAAVAAPGRAQGRRRLPREAVGTRHEEASERAPAPACLYAGPRARAATPRATCSPTTYTRSSSTTEAEHERVVEFVSVFMPEPPQDIELYQGDSPVFDEYGIEDEISRALSRKVPLPSGGYLVIDQAEALTAIDVNTGRFVGTRQGSRRDDPADQPRGREGDRPCSCASAISAA